MTCKFCGDAMLQTQTYLMRGPRSDKPDRPEKYLCPRCGAQLTRQTTGTESWETPLYEPKGKPA